MTKTSLTVGEAVREAAARLRESGSRSPRLDAELLLATVLGVERTELLRAPERALTAGEARRFDDVVRRREAHEPVAYIRGTRAFRTLELEVTPEVLIPRADTETLVDVALEVLAAVPMRADGTAEYEPRVLDVGTGSGCVALSLAAENPFVRVTAVDVSEAAADVARRNAARLGLGGRVTVLVSDLLAGLDVVYSLQGSKGFYRYSTSQTESPLISGCSGGGDCSRFSNTGIRNARFSLANRLDLSVDFLAWLGIELTAIHRMAFLYAIQADDPRVSYVPQQPTGDRQFVEFEGNVRVRPMKSLEVALGVSTLSPILAPDSTFYTPFVNRYTMGFVEVRVLLDGLVAQIFPGTYAE